MSYRPTTDHLVCTVYMDAQRRIYTKAVEAFDANAGDLANDLHAVAPHLAHYEAAMCALEELGHNPRAGRDNPLTRAYFALIAAYADAVAEAIERAEVAA